MFRSVLGLFENKYIGISTSYYKIHTTSRLSHETFKLTNEDVRDSSLWFTTLPEVSKKVLSGVVRRKAKATQKPMRTGPLLITCKNKKLNHYKGVHYKKFSAIPLASKGWHHKKANGDYFSILPSIARPAFIMPENYTSLNESEYQESEPDKFETLGINPDLQQRLKEIGIQYPTTIQLKAIPKILAGRNVLVTADTGCGKTLAYVIPMLEHILHWKSKVNLDYNCPLGVVVVPSRELALQVGEVISELTENLDVACKVVLANRTKRFLQNLNSNSFNKVHVVVATLGILCKLTYHKVYSLSSCIHLVLDEADTLLDDSFNPKLQVLLRRLQFRFDGIRKDQEDVPQGAHLSIVSATMPKDLENILDTVFPSKLLEHISTDNLHKIQPHIKHTFIRCSKSDKVRRVLELVRLYLKENLPVLIFSNKTETCNWLAHFFKENKIGCARFNSRMMNEERLNELQKFKDGTVNVLVCTDLASRGQNIIKVKRVINYEFPRYMADYVHRCGRTGRIGNEDNCEVTSFLSSARDVPLLNEIEKSARLNDKLPNVNNNINRLLKIRYNNREAM